MRAYDESSQRAAIRAIALGSLRWYLRLAPAIDGLLSRPQGVANEIRALLVVSAHQIEYSRNAPQATAHAAVDAANRLAQGDDKFEPCDILKKHARDGSKFYES